MKSIFSIFILFFLSISAFANNLQPDIYTDGHICPNCIPGTTVPSQGLGQGLIPWTMSYTIYANDISVLHSSGFDNTSIVLKKGYPSAVNHLTASSRLHATLSFKCELMVGPKNAPAPRQPKPLEADLTLGKAEDGYLPASGNFPNAVRYLSYRERISGCPFPYPHDCPTYADYACTQFLTLTLDGKPQVLTDYGATLENILGWRDIPKEP